MIICIDSNVIIWGIKKQPSAGQESLVSAAEYFFKWADDNNHEIIIPTVVLAEVLAREAEEVRAKYLEALNKAFIIVNFDTKVALKYAQILHNRFEEVKKIAAENSVERQKMKMDHVIVASAIVNGAKWIVSYDKGLKSFAKGFIDVKEFPLPPSPVVHLFSHLEEEFLHPKEEIVVTPTPVVSIEEKTEKSAEEHQAIINTVVETAPPPAGIEINELKIVDNDKSSETNSEETSGQV